MRPGALMLALLVASTGITSAFVYTAPRFPLVLIPLAVCVLAGLLVFWFRPADQALFLLAQPSVFLAWDVSFTISLLLESALSLGLLFCLGMLKERSTISLHAMFLVAMAIVTLVLSMAAHVIVPIVIFLAAAALVYLGIMGLAYRTSSLTGGGAR